MNAYRKIAGAVMISLASLSGYAQTSDALKNERQNIDAQYKSAMAQCKAMKGNAKDVCEEEAKGNEKVAKAELAARENPNEVTQYKARMTKAEAAYDVAKERCDDQTGNAKDVCKKDAKAAYEKAKGEAKVQRAEATPSVSPARKEADVSNARKDAAQNAREAEYKAAEQRCDALSGAQKDACIDEAKTHFPK